MKKKRSILLALTLIIFFIILCAIFVNSKLNSATLSFTGKVTHINNECYVDGTCSLTIDNKIIVITGCGLTANGSTCASYDQSKLKLGDKISVKAQKEKGTYTLNCEGCGISKQ